MAEGGRAAGPRRALRETDTPGLPPAGVEGGLSRSETRQRRRCPGYGLAIGRWRETAGPARAGSALSSPAQDGRAVRR